MPFAANGIVQQDPINGGIEITFEQYTEAVEGMCSGLSVTIDDGFKVAPAPVPEPNIPNPPTPAELAAIALSQRDSLLGSATLRIGPLQDAIDLGEATPEEINLLTRWKQYRVALNRIEQQAEFPVVIDWPVSPD
ncbi:tail fiber assembly protein [Pseudomonas sp. NR3]|uniref:tail fiber assembly protein n=1 Tax=Pseudomonas sp. NR3 TaxID=3155978 RepID=UPI003B682E53